MKTRASSCGCCEGVEKLTPASLANRPGLRALQFRAGTYSTFLRTMLARLSSAPTADFDAAGHPILAGLTTRDPSDPAIALLDGWATVADVLTFYDERIANEGYLRTATERRSVLELARLVGYAPRPGVSATAYLAYTIDEDRSVTPPKGMEVTVPAGSRAQSTPGPNELPQTFETFEPLPARTAWNKLQPRLSRPQTAESIRMRGIYFKGTATNLKPNDPLLLDLRAGGGRLFAVRVLVIAADVPANRTYITIRPWWRSDARIVALVHFAQARRENLPEDPDRQKVFDILTDLLESAKKSASDFQTHLGDILGKLIEVFKDVSSAGRATGPWLDEIIAEVESAQEDLADSLRFENQVAAKAERRATKLFDLLAPAPSLLPRSSISLGQTLATTLKTGSDVFPRLMTRFRPALGNVLASALANATIAPPTDLKVYALRVSASLFGHNLPDQPIFNDDGKRIDTVVGTLNTTWKNVPLPSGTDTFPAIALEAEYEQVKTNDFLVIDRAEAHEFPVFDHAVGLGSPIPKAASAPLVGAAVTIHTVKSASARTLNALGVSAKSTVATISPDWFSDTRSAVGNARGMPLILRGTRVYAQSELLPLAEAPVPDPVCNAEIELDGLYDGLKAGRWVILSGERANLSDANGEPLRGIRAAELGMIASVAHRVAPATDKKAPAPGDKTHTFITLSADPSSCYVRETMTLYGNVVKATHGETRKEVLGSGDTSKPMQSFPLKQPPLTFLPAPTADGAASTLVVRVNEVEWHETDSLAGLAPNDRKFVTKTDDDAKTTVVFGNGRNGARPPTGANNITAVYRNGIGQPGNAKAEQINQLTTRPLGVKEVLNPLPATGGADREDRDQTRENAPLGILALDRLVSVQDYADFTRTFAGIGKASAKKLSDGAREVVYVTIAGANDIPIDKNSDLYTNLTSALHSLGDPHLPIMVELREMLSLVISAQVSVLPDYAWEFVEPKVRSALLDAFSFARRDLGQDVTRSEVISVIQAVRGVAYVDLDLLATISQSEAEAELTRTTTDGGQGDDSQSLVSTLADVGRRVIVEAARAHPEAKNYSDRLTSAQIAVLSPALPETLVLMEAKK
jgi:predicted phage baseplate assembly protein